MLHKFPEKTYYISDTKMTWDKASKFCADNGMTLTTFDSREEASYFVSITTGNIWVGIRDLDKNKKFLRITDKKDVTGILPWGEQEPNNKYGQEYCVHRYEMKVGFNDRGCHHELNFSCVKLNSN